MRAILTTAATLLLLCASAAHASIAHNGNTFGAPLPTVELTVSQPPGPFLHHTVVSVGWTYTSGTVDPELDWVSVWWEPFAATYVEYANVSSAIGNATFELLNARHAYVFRFYRGNTSIAEATEKAIPDATFPMGARVVLSGTDANQVTVMWTSNRSVNGVTAVQYGFSPSELVSTKHAEAALTYTATELNERLQLPPIAARTEPFENIGARRLRCGWGTCYNDFTANELWVEPGIQHVAYLTELAPATTYFYRVGELGGHMSAVRRFTTKAAPSPNSSISVMYVADAGAGYAVGGFAGGAADNDCPIPPVFEPDGAKFVWEAIRRDPLTRFDTASIMNGDVSYARGWPYLWELFHNETEDVFGQLPVMLAFGNHEMDFGHNPFALTAGGDSGGECGIATGRRFNLNEERPWFYVKDGPAFFVVLSSEHDPIRQAQWMKNVAFKALDRSVTPWVIVMFHRPIFESNNWVGKDLQHLMRVQYADLFVRYNVDLVLTGHAHYYERLCAISSESCNTWGYRDVWTQYENVVLSEGFADHCSFRGAANDTWACRAECARAQPGAQLKGGNCTGTLFDDDSNTCTLLTCAQPYQLTPKHYRSVWSMEKQPGTAPVYIVDGTAGGVHVPVSTPFSPWTEYKDFLTWGYSRMLINGTHLTWNHYHVDGRIVDTVTLVRV